jgi:hypothetical protein
LHSSISKWREVQSHCLHAFSSRLCR